MITWQDKKHPKIKELAKKHWAEIFWVDEASIRSDDPLQRIWGLKEETSIVKTSGQRQSVSAISALSNKDSFWYHVYSGRFNREKFMLKLKDVVPKNEG